MKASQIASKPLASAPRSTVGINIPLAVTSHLVHMYLNQVDCDITFVPTDHEASGAISVHWVVFYGSEPISLARKHEPNPRIKMDYSFAALKLVTDTCYGLFDGGEEISHLDGEELIEALRAVDYIGLPLRIPGIGGAIINRIRAELSNCVDKEIESPTLSSVLYYAQSLQVMHEIATEYAKEVYSGLYEKRMTFGSDQSHLLRDYTADASRAPVRIKRHVCAQYGSQEDDDALFALYVKTRPAGCVVLELTHIRASIDMCRRIVSKQTPKDAVSDLCGTIICEGAGARNIRVYAERAWETICLSGAGEFATERAHANYRAITYAATRYTAVDAIWVRDRQGNHDKSMSYETRLRHMRADPILKAAWDAVDEVAEEIIRAAAERRIEKCKQTARSSNAIIWPETSADSTNVGATGGEKITPPCPPQAIACA